MRIKEMITRNKICCKNKVSQRVHHKKNNIKNSGERQHVDSGTKRLRVEITHVFPHKNTNDAARM